MSSVTKETISTIDGVGETFDKASVNACRMGVGNQEQHAKRQRPLHPNEEAFIEQQKGQQMQL